MDVPLTAGAHHMMGLASGRGRDGAEDGTRVVGYMVDERDGMGFLCQICLESRPVYCF